METEARRLFAQTAMLPVLISSNPRLRSSKRVAQVPESILILYLFTWRSLLSPDGMPCVVLWRPAARDGRVPITPETWNGLSRDPPSLGVEAQTSCI